MADGDEADDIVFGDNAFLLRRVVEAALPAVTDYAGIVDTTSGRFQTLCGTLLYSRTDRPNACAFGNPVGSDNSGQLLVNGVWRPYRDPDSPGHRHAPVVGGVPDRLRRRGPEPPVPQLRRAALGGRPGQPRRQGRGQLRQRLPRRRPRARPAVRPDGQRRDPGRRRHRGRVRRQLARGRVALAGRLRRHAGRQPRLRLRRRSRHRPVATRRRPTARTTSRAAAATTSSSAASARTTSSAAAPTSSAWSTRRSRLVGQTLKISGETGVWRSWRSTAARSRSRARSCRPAPTHATSRSSGPTGSSPAHRWCSATRATTRR